MLEPSSSSSSGIVGLKHKVVLSLVAAASSSDTNDPAMLSWTFVDQQTNHPLSCRQINRTGLCESWATRFHRTARSSWVSLATQNYESCPQSFTEASKLTPSSIKPLEMTSQTLSTIKLHVRASLATSWQFFGVPRAAARHNSVDP